MSNSSPSGAASVRDVLFVDSRLDFDTSQVADSTRVVRIAPDEDGVAVMSQVLSQHDGLASVQVLGHGSAGSLSLGSVELNDATLAQYESAVRGWGSALSEDGDLLLFGCDVAAGESGKTFVSRIAALTGADVAASDDLTGNAARGGDWELEYRSGEIEAGAALSLEVLAEFEGILLKTYTASNAVLLASEIEKANSDGQMSVIKLTGNISLGAHLASIKEDLIVDGQGYWIDGQSDTQIFYVNNGYHLSLVNIDLRNGLAKGSNGEAGKDAGGGGGGGGLGAGGAVYSSTDSTLTLHDVTFSGNQAIGGKGGKGGPDGMRYNEKGGEGGKGGGFNFNRIGKSGGNGGSGGVGAEGRADDDFGESGSNGSDGGFGDGGGGGGTGGASRDGGKRGGNGGDGGDGDYGAGGGGGGGGGRDGDDDLDDISNHGAGGGAGFGGGKGGGVDTGKGRNNGGGGGGGAGFGGAVFASTNATLNIYGPVSFSSNSAQGGSGGSGHYYDGEAGKGLGDNLYLRGTASAFSTGAAPAGTSYTGTFQAYDLPTVTIGGSEDGDEGQNGEDVKNPSVLLKLDKTYLHPVVVEYSIDGVRGTATIPYLEDSAEVSLSIDDDTDYNPDREIAFELRNSSLYARGATRSVTLSVADNEPTIEISGDATATEGGNHTFTVTFDKPAPHNFVIPYTVGGTATEGNDADYAPLTGTLSVAQGETSKTITVNTNDDTELEDDETVIVTLGNSSKGAGKDYNLGTAAPR